MSASPQFASTPRIEAVTIVNADASGLKQLVVAGSNGTKVTAVIASSDDSSARVVKVYLTRSGTDYLLGAVNVPTLSGTDGSAANVNLLGLLVGLPIDNDGQRYLLLKSGDTLKVATTTTVTSAKTVTCVAVAGDL